MDDAADRMLSFSLNLHSFCFGELTIPHVPSYWRKGQW